jgi:hypothetical protein
MRPSSSAASIVEFTERTTRGSSGRADPYAARKTRECDAVVWRHKVPRILQKGNLAANGLSVTELQM